MYPAPPTMGRLLDFCGKGVWLGHFRYIQTGLKLFKLVNRFTVSRAAGRPMYPNYGGVI